MIFNVVWNYSKEDPSLNDKIQAFENILLSYRDRNNLVYCHKNIIKNIIPDIGKSLQATAYEVLSFSKEYKQLIADLSISVNVNFNVANSLKNERVNGKCFIDISYDHFLTLKRASCATLIPEHDNDYNLYKLIGEAYLKKNRYFAMNIKLGKHCGYGSHAHRVYSEYKNNKEFAFCIIDNDKKFPGDSVGSTAKPFSDKDFSVNGTVEAKLINMREVESLIPIKVLEDAVINGTYPKETIDIYNKVKELNDASEGVFREYFDHKDGLYLRDALKPKYRSFWKPFFKHERTINLKSCYQNNNCTDCDNCIKLQGFGNQILENSVVKMQTSNLVSIYNNLSDSIRDEWNIIGDKIISWGCAPSGRRARAS